MGEITVIACSGRLVEGAEAATLQDRLSALLPHAPRIVLNLAEVDFLDSSGIGLLVRFVVRTRRDGGDLKLCAVPPRITEVLKATRLGRCSTRKPARPRPSPRSINVRN